MLGHLVPPPPNLDHRLNFHLSSCLLIPTPLLCDVAPGVTPNLQTGKLRFRENRSLD